jgi:hypothetical protein
MAFLFRIESPAETKSLSFYDAMMFYHSGIVANWKIRIRERYYILTPYDNLGRKVVPWYPSEQFRSQGIRLVEVSKAVFDLTPPTTPSLFLPSPIFFEFWRNPMGKISAIPSAIHNPTSKENSQHFPRSLAYSLRGRFEYLVVLRIPHISVSSN